MKTCKLLGGTQLNARKQSKKLLSIEIVLLTYTSKQKRDFKIFNEARCQTSSPNVWQSYRSTKQSLVCKSLYLSQKFSNNKSIYQRWAQTWSDSYVHSGNKALITHCRINKELRRLKNDIWRYVYRRPRSTWSKYTRRLMSKCLSLKTYSTRRRAVQCNCALQVCKLSPHPT